MRPRPEWTTLSSNGLPTQLAGGEGAYWRLARISRGAVGGALDAGIGWDDGAGGKRGAPIPASAGNLFPQSTPGPRPRHGEDPVPDVSQTPVHHLIISPAGSHLVGPQTDPGPPGCVWGPTWIRPPPPPKSTALPFSVIETPSGNARLLFLVCEQTHEKRTPRSLQGYLAHKKHPPPEDHHRSLLGIGLL